MQKMRALIINGNANLMYHLPSILNRAGFEIDVVAVTALLKKNKLISNYEVWGDLQRLLARVCEMNVDHYDFVIVCDDRMLKAISGANISVAKKLKLLPVCGEKDFKHLHSKIGLSQVLSDAGVATPAFGVATNIDESLEIAANLGYPIMLKIDASSSGLGVFECKNERDIKSLAPKVFEKPVLIQKKLEGLELDMSALYKDGNLLHFSYSQAEKTVSKFGPSSVKKYQQLGSVNPEIFLEMTKLGKALGADGFANISCVKSDDDGKIYFFESDMRPNVWVDYTKFVGDDLAPKIANWFSNSKAPQYPQALNEAYPEELRIPYFFRISLLEILLNRYNVWQFMSLEDLEWMVRKKYFDAKMVAIRKKRELFKKIKKVNKLPTQIIRLVVPEKEDRIHIKSQLKRLVGFA